MPVEKIILFVLLGVLAGAFTVVWFVHMRRHGWPRTTGYQVLVGFTTNFFDTLGIGSFATTTALFRLRRAIDDKDLPGTLNVGHSIPTIVQAYYAISVIEVEMRTLILLIAASVCGAWFGAGVVAHLPRRKVQVGMGTALIAAAILMLFKLSKHSPGAGMALGLDAEWLAIAFAGNFLFGALMTIGVGAYAPIMIMVSLLGMNPITALPIMMGSCAFLMPVAGIRFIRKGAFDNRASLGLTLGGIPAVLLVVYIIKSLPLDYVMGLVVVVALYTAISLLRASRV